MQKKQKNFQVAIIGVLAFAVLAMSVGFAAYAQTLNISGSNVTVANSKWSVHFKDAAPEVNPASVGGTINSHNATDISFTAPLAKVGDKYEFDTVVLNDGNFDAELSHITLSGVSDEQNNYIDYYVVIDGVTYDQASNDLHIALPKAEGSKKVTIGVVYVQPADHNQLPKVPQTLNLGASFTFNQTDEIK